MDIKNLNGDVIYSVKRDGLSNANLRGADLSYADLSYADLSCANLSDANLSYVKTNYITAGYYSTCPTSGQFEAWAKKSGHIIQLLIPADAERSSATTRKCRASKVKVISIFPKKEEILHDSFGYITKYKVGEFVLPDKWDPDRWNECSNGIHFFMTREEAESWTG